MPTPQRLPIVNSDDGVWGDILRQYLLKEHYDDGTDNAVNGGHKTVTIQPGTAAAGTAPLKFTSGTLLTTPEAGAVEFNSDKLYFTKTTGPTRQTVATYDTTGSTGDIYYRDSSSNFVRLAVGSTGDMLTVSSGLPAWSSTIPNTATVTVKDANFTIQDDGDTTKQVKFQASGLTTATTRTLTIPDANTTIVGTDATQTLTNKTISGPQLTGTSQIQSTGTLEIYNTADQTTNYERFRLAWVSNSFNFESQNGGTGTLRAIQLSALSGGVTSGGLRLNTSSPNGVVESFLTTNSSAGAIIHKVSATSLAASSSTQYGLAINPTVNQSLTAGYTMLLVNPTESTTGSGAKLLADFQVGGTSKLTIDNSGSIAQASGAETSLHNQADQTTNYERLRVSWGDNIARLLTEAGGTGTVRQLTIGTSNRYINFVDGGSSAGFYQFAASTGTSDTSIVAITNTLSSTSGVNSILKINPTFTQSGTAGYTAFLINATESTTGSGTKLLIDAQVGGVSKFKVDNTGVVTMAAVGTGAGSVVTTDGTQTLTNKTLTSPKIQLIADTNGNTALQTLARSSAVNYVVVANAATGSGPEIGPTGGDASIDMNVSMRGISKAINLIDGSAGVIAKFTSQGSVVNYVRVHPGTTGVAPYVSVEGSDTNVSLNLKSKGTGTVQANGVDVVTISSTQTLTNKTIQSPTITDSNGVTALTIAPVVSAVNYIGINNNIAGSGPIVRALGSDTNIRLNLRSKGTGSIAMYDGGNLPIGEFVPVTSAVNYTRFDNSATGNAIPIRAVGSDTNISWNFVPKGTGTVQVNGVDVVTTTGTQTLTNKILTAPIINQINDTNGAAALGIATAASAVNYIQIGNNSTGNRPNITIVGTDTNVGLGINSKGTGTIYLQNSLGVKSIVASPVTSGVNYLQVTAAITGAAVAVAATGSDTNVSLNLTSKGSGTVQANGNPVVSSVTAIPAVTGTPSSSTYLRGDGTWSAVSGAGGMLAPAQGMVNTETLTISAGSVTQITGTTVNGYTPAVGDRILIANANAASGAANSYSMTTQPANGVYVVTNNTTNLTVSRATDMSGSNKPNGMSVYVQNATWPASRLIFYVETPNDQSAFTWGTTSLEFTYAGGPSGQTRQVWVTNNGIGYNIYNGTGWTTFAGTTNAGNQNLTLPATATDTIVARTSTDTLTNKRVTPRAGTTTSSATPTINTDNYDIYGLTAQAVDITSFTTNLTGTPTDGQKLWIYIVGTAARAITWGSSFENGPIALPTTTVTTQRLDVGFIWNAATSKWRCVASGSA